MEFSFEDFKNRAADKNLSKWEKIGFPDAYRKGKEADIFQDIAEKLQLKKENQNILDIGSGCSELAELLIKHAATSNSKLFLIDSAEMLDNIDRSNLHSNVILVPGYFPKIKNFNETYSGKIDAILAYSVIQYVFLEQSIFQFIHACIDLLQPGGRLLLGDIPNYAARERFLNSAAGSEFKKNAESAHTDLALNHENRERIDDSVVFSILSRFRNFGCETYLLPQNEKLPFANRREDILIIKR
ncbi:MAG: hypothetical protein SH857_04530 [Chitinophagales bacterium]|nr:hypothetical protein [Chitinophagales bacterium]